MRDFLLPDGASEMRLFHTIRRTSVAVIAASIVLLPSSVFAQSEQVRLASSLEAAAAQAAAQPGGEVVRRTSIDDAVKLALEQNLGIRIQRIDPQIQDMGVAQAQALWRPNLTTRLQRNSQVQQSTNVLSGRTTSIDHGTFYTQVGSYQTLPWAG